jgi:tetratricopeptide (TPR) repeat protein
LGQRELAAEAEVLLGERFGNQGVREREDEHLERAAALIDGLPPSRSKALTLTHLGASLMLAGRYEDAIRVCREGLQIATKLGLDDIRAHALNSLGISRTTLGDADGIADIERALGIALEKNLPNEGVRAYGNLAEMAGNYVGDLARAFELRAEGRKLAEKFGLAGSIRFLRGELVIQWYWTGRWDDALELADELLSEAEADSPNYMDSQCLLAKARIGLARGERLMIADADGALETARTVRDPQALYPALAFRARAESAAGRLDEASALADELLSSWANRPDAMLDSHLQSFVDAAEVLRALGRGSELIAVAAKARHQTRWTGAATAFVSGDFLRAAEIYAAAGSAPDEAFARLRAAEALIAGGRRAEGDEQLQRALGFYRSVGASAYLRQGEALLARTA